MARLFRIEFQDCGAGALEEPAVEIDTRSLVRECSAAGGALLGNDEGERRAGVKDDFRAALLALHADPVQVLQHVGHVFVLHAHGSVQRFFAGRPRFSLPAGMSQLVSLHLAHCLGLAALRLIQT